ncbi:MULTISPECIES: carboxymuconolactone decarboxylase family protein [Kitasatospora]|uniref:Putative carboxymuconolactone decarboxylase n=1 Tax=Kitasatospora setae (strain ATCC 33774 / DSM 43861 / JCM 3304 / KCC A-0304 / NBRC 14216 / KM-6054) TaxID=452652 RepID=E4N6B6_KITSK|nr:MULTISPECIES: carboxymuconolactone decarboxylase family protein [Kitasatospora]BAJ26747.1 putative carboxymuconolactone decarboxylase [Kitasatospora setae KM-6054]
MTTYRNAEERHTSGLAKLEEVAGTELKERFLENLRNVSPEFRDYVSDFIYGEIYSREGELDLLEKEQVTLVTLAAQGGLDYELRLHLRAALQLGISPARIADLFIQMSPYAGFPRGLSAILCLKDALSDVTTAEFVREHRR